MPTLNINGQRVRVGDEFLSLTPEQQNDTVDEIASGLSPIPSAGFGAVGTNPMYGDIPAGFHLDDGAFSDIPEGFSPVPSRGRSTPAPDYRAFRAFFSAPNEEGAKPDFRALFAAPDTDGATAGPVRARDLFLRSMIGQGAMAGFGDEAEAAARATAAKASGDKRSWNELYDFHLHNARTMLERFGSKHPTEATLAEITGAVAPVLLSGGTAAPATLGAAARAGMARGALYGGAHGFGTGEGEAERLSQAGVGAGVGSAVGAAAPAVVAAGGAAIRGLGNIATPVRGLLGAEREAARRVARAIDRDQGAGLTAQQVQAARRSGQPIANVDLGGETTRALARSAANTSPEARAALDRTINDRFESQGDRVSNFVRQLVSGDAASTTRETLLREARAVNRPAYARAYAQGSRGIWTPELERLASSPDVLRAMQTAVATGKSRAVNEGFGMFNPGVRVTPAGLRFGGGKNGPTRPTLQYWDYVKRELDDAANAARRAGRNEEGSRLAGQASLLRDELDRAVPTYRQARQGAAAFFGADDALEAGERFINMTSDVASARRAILRMSPAERRLFGEGFASALLDKVSKTRDRVNVVNTIYGSAKSRQQIETALGTAKAKELEAFMRIEAVMDRARGAVQGNSTTTRQLVEMGLAGGATGIFTGDPVSGLAAALTWGAARRGAVKVDQRVARKVGEMLASNNPAVFQRGVKALANSKSLMTALRQGMSQMAGPVSAQQGN